MIDMTKRLEEEEAAMINRLNNTMAKEKGAQA
jgi:hypothetical protein